MITRNTLLAAAALALLAARSQRTSARQLQSECQQHEFDRVHEHRSGPEQ